jgi:hypothetical protein
LRVRFCAYPATPGLPVSLTDLVARIINVAVILTEAFILNGAAVELAEVSCYPLGLAGTGTVTTF